MLFEKLCLLCGEKFNEKSSFTCEKCINILKYELSEYSDTNIKNMYFDELYSAFLYKGFVRKKILDFKFCNSPYMGKVFAEYMMTLLSKNAVTADLIVPIPIHYKRYFERGYNQSKVLAQCIANSLHISMNNSLKKVINTNRQSTLCADARKVNVLNSFKITNSDIIKGKTILLVDDIYTTGATANECSRMLKESGAKKVIVVTIAYGKF